MDVQEAGNGAGRWRVEMKNRGQDSSFDPVRGVVLRIIA
jgi:hypothetical protein